jgi:hypothetical protein
LARHPEIAVAELRRVLLDDPGLEIRNGYRPRLTHFAIKPPPDSGVGGARVRTEGPLLGVFGAVDDLVSLQRAEALEGLARGRQRSRRLVERSLGADETHWGKTARRAS